MLHNMSYTALVEFLRPRLCIRTVSSCYRSCRDLRSSPSPQNSALISSIVARVARSFYDLLRHMAPKKAPAMGQRSITAFMVKRHAPLTDNNAKASGAPADENEHTAKRQQTRQAEAPRDEPTAGQAAAQLAPSDEHAAAGGAASPVPAAAIPQRDQRRHVRAQLKLVGALNSTSLANPGGAQGGRAGGTGRPKYTPLEEQVVALKQANPGVLLVVEVGYKMRFFGEDAEVASRVLGLYAYPDHNFLTASIPVGRLPVHVRRLVQAGCKVGVCRQTETAALKSVSSNRSGPFERKLTALYTAATLDAGERADKIGEEAAMEESQGLDALMPRTAGGAYLMVVAEEQAPAQQQVVNGSSNQQGYNKPAGAGGEDGTATAAAAASGRAGDAPSHSVAIVAVDAASGDVVYGLTSSGAVVQSGLEAALLSLAPAEVVALEPISHETARLLERFAGRGSEQGGTGSSDARGGRVARLARVQGGSYLSNAALARLSEFYSAGDEGHGDGGGGAEAAARATGSSAASRGARNAEGTPGGGGGGRGGGDGAGSSSALDFVLSLPPLVLQALSAAVEYLEQFSLACVLHDTANFRPLSGAEGLQLSSNALQQLELLSTVEGAYSGSLLHLLDRTATGFGSRLLRRWVAHPLADRALIMDRLDAVEELSSSPSAALSSLPSELRRLPDLERAFMRCAHSTAAPSEAVAALKALKLLPERLGIRLPQQQPDGDDPASAAESALSSVANSPLLRRVLADACSPAATGAASAALILLDEAAARDNNHLALFRSRERFPEVFERAEAVAAAEAHLHSLLPQLARALGLAPGKLKYVCIQHQGDWLVELPADRSNVPTGWEKVCSTKKVSRWHPPEVRSGMTRLSVARETHQAACRAAWISFMEEFSRLHHATCRRAVTALATLDALCSLAAVAQSSGYCRPVMVEEGEAPRLVIRGGRHPTLDLQLQGGAVPNDVELRWDGRRAAIVTGPNMGGKSVYLRMIAVIAIMTHCGSFIPAQSAEVSVMDSVLTRMGAADDLSNGRSTFQEEMSNAAEMLARATPRSLVILDELGRGTATRDGIAVACATLDHLVDRRQCLTLFTTHYPEVWEGFATDPLRSQRVGVWHMASEQQQQQQRQKRQKHEEHQECGGGAASASTKDAAGASPSGRSSGDEGAAGGGLTDLPPSLVFLYRMRPGGASQSFGLNVARMAGLPAPVVARAGAVAAQLQRQAQAMTGAVGGQQEQRGRADAGRMEVHEEDGLPASLSGLCHDALAALRTARAQQEGEHEGGGSGDDGGGDVNGSDGTDGQPWQPQQQQQGVQSQQQTLEWLRHLQQQAREVLQAQ